MSKQDQAKDVKMTVRLSTKMDDRVDSIAKAYGLTKNSVMVVAAILFLDRMERTKEQHNLKPGSKRARVEAALNAVFEGMQESY